MRNSQIRLMALLMLVLFSVTLLVDAQYPARLSIPGALPVPTLVSARPQFRSDNHRVVRVRRPTALPRLIEEPKPVIESAEEEDTVPDAFLPSLLREQQLAQAQQAQFHQAAAAFLNGAGADNSGGLLHETQTTLLQEEEAPLTVPTRFAERPAPQQASPPALRPAFNDYGIGAGLGAAQRFGSTATPVTAPPPQPTPQRFNVVRSRPASRPHYEAQAAPAPAPAPQRPRPKPIQPRPLIDQNQLQQDDRNGDGQQQQRGRRPVAQTLRKWRDENEDGSITWGYENDDGSFKEELIGTDCITKGTYGYIDPDGNKREYHYETGIKCDPNARDAEEEELDENGFINYEDNKAVLPNGIEIDMAQLGKRKSKRPAANYRN